MNQKILDFVSIRIERKQTKSGTTWIVSPRFHVCESKYLMVRGGDFFAFNDGKNPLWSKKEQTLIDFVDRALREEADKVPLVDGDNIIINYLSYSDTGSIDQWHKFVKQQMRDNFHPLDEKIIFANTEVKREDYASKALPYALVKGECPAYNELMGTLYDPEELEKLEWAVGAIITGDSKHIQKFEVLYGDKGTGKGTFLNEVLGKLFDGYTASFNDKALASGGGFPLESLKENPPVGIQGDGDLSHIKDNTIINSLVSHEYMPVNAKYEKIYRQKFGTFLFIGTNSPVEITDDKSGLMRRLIDIHPSGRKLPYKRYHQLKKQLEFELGAIAYHCLEVYKELGEDYYEDYVPLRMMAETNDFYNFMEYHYEDFVKEDMVTLVQAWKQYGEYCEFANAFKMGYRKFRIELGGYWRNFEERGMVDGKRVRSLYSGFRTDKFEIPDRAKRAKKGTISWLRFDCETSLFDQVFSLCLSQGCKEDGSPLRSWKNVKTRLCDIDTRSLHWVKPPGKLICIDFDIKGEDGEKNLDRNIEAALKWPKTYAELSKSGKAIHLYYYYEGDVSRLSSVYEPYIEVKTFPEDSGSSLRRMLTKCNDIPIATISSGLPLKGDTKVQSDDTIKNEKQIRALILKGLRKEIHPDTTSNVDFIKMILDKAYESRIGYDVTDLYQAVLLFAMRSSNQSDKCIDTVSKMKFKSEEVSEPIRDTYEGDEDDLYFFDVEIYRPDVATNNPGLFLICWKKLGRDNISVMVNPKPFEVEQLFYPKPGVKRKMIGFNCRNYDNPMCWAASMGYSNEQLYDLSQRIIVGHERPFMESVNWSFLDIYDAATEKMGLKKWEIRLKKTHKEMGIPWDQPAPLDRWDEIISYCKNDVLATEAVYLARVGDVRARKFQVTLVDILHPDENINVCVNDTTNTLSKRGIFGNERKPQREFNWRDMSKPVGSDEYEYYLEHFGEDYKFRVFDANGLPLYRDYIPGEILPAGWSILPFFPGYKCEPNEKHKYVSTYLGQTVGEGGRVFSNIGYYEWVWDGDVSSMHPHSIISERLFGPRYTRTYEDIVDARVAVKHKDFDTAGSLLNGALKPYLSEEYAPDIAQALKIVANSVYGLTKAGFANEFRDPRNYDNIVAKRGALFMTLLKREVEARGGNVIHIKTDSIKIANCGKAMQEFVIKFGREFGYDFETEGVFTKFCLFNDAAYIARTDKGEWLTKADQFKAEKQPYLFKTLFSHEPYEFDDFCETKSVSEGALYLDMNEDLGEPVDEAYEKAVKKLEKLIAKAEKDGNATTNVGIKMQEAICAQLKEELPKHHNYVFVGRVGQFTPVKKGEGGGVLYRMLDGKYYAATGTTGYRWLESDYLREYGKTDIVDMDFYRKRVDEAKKAINDMVDVDWFLNGDDPPFKEDPFIDISFMNIPEGVGEEIPFDADYTV